MRKQILLSICVLYSFMTFGQEKATLTKEETVNYINKKLKESIDFEFRDLYVLSSTIEITECSITVTQEFSNYQNESAKSNHADFYKLYNRFEFNPAQIGFIEKVTGMTGETGEQLQISLNSKTGKYIGIRFANVEKERTVYKPIVGSHLRSKEIETYYEYEKIRESKLPEDEININYLGSDKTNFNKLKKAFEHLRDLCKAEDDPFGN